MLVTPKINIFPKRYTLPWGAAWGSDFETKSLFSQPNESYGGILIFTLERCLCIPTNCFSQTRPSPVIYTISSQKDFGNNLSPDSSSHKLHSISAAIQPPFRLQALTKSLSVAIMHSEMPPEGRQAAIAGFQNGQVCDCVD